MKNNTNEFQETLRYELTCYLSQLMQEYIAENELEDEDEDDLYYDDDFKCYVEDDLETAGLDVFDAQSIADQTFNSDTSMYRFLAYRFTFYGNYNNIETLKSIISENSNINAFDYEDLNNILEESKSIN